MSFEDIMTQIDVSRYVNAINSGQTKSSLEYQLVYVKNNSTALAHANDLLGNYLDLNVEPLLSMYNTFYDSISDGFNYKGVSSLIGKIGGTNFNPRDIPADTFYKTSTDSLPSSSGFSTKIQDFIPNPFKTIYDVRALDLDGSPENALIDSPKTIDIDIKSYLSNIFNY